MFFIFTTKKMIRQYYLLFLALTCGVASSSMAQSETGIVTYYADYMQGRPTASTEAYDVQKFTCSHKTLPFGTLLKVTNLKNGQSVAVKVNDRQSMTGTNIASLSRGAAAAIDLIHYGKVTARLEVVTASNALAQMQGTVPNNLTASSNNQALGNQPAPQTQVGQNNAQAQQLLKAVSANPKRQLLGYFDANFNRVQISGYGLQLATFANAKTAVALCNRLQTDGYKDAYIQILVETNAQTNTKLGQEYRVIVGQGPESYVQQSLLNYFKGHGYVNCAVVKYE